MTSAIRSLLPRSPVARRHRESRGSSRRSRRYAARPRRSSSDSSQIVAIGRVVQLEPTVAAVDGDAFEEMVERLALHLVRVLYERFERQAIGDVLVNESEAAERMWRDRQQQVRPSGRCSSSCCGSISEVNIASCWRLKARKSADSGRRRRSRSRSSNLLERGLSSEPVLFDAPQSRRMRR